MQRQQMVSRILACSAVVVLSACVAGQRRSTVSSSPDVWVPENAPADLQEMIRKKDSKGIGERGWYELTVNVGNAFPTIVGRRKGTAAEIPDDFRGQRVAVLFAGGPCSLTLEWLAQLDANAWRIAGADVLVVLTLLDGRDEVTARIPKTVKRFAVDMPLPGYLAYAYWYPTMFVVDEDGTFLGATSRPALSVTGIVEGGGRPRALPPPPQVDMR